MDDLWANPFKNQTKQNDGSSHYTVYPEKVPQKNFTVFYSKTEGRVPIEYNMNISFTLVDSFGNLFEGIHDCVNKPYLRLLYNDVLLKVISMKLLPGEITYEFLVKPKYPPKNVSMNVKYIDEYDNGYFVADIEFIKTKIISRN